MKLTCWVWLVALGSAGVANAEIPQIKCFRVNHGGGVQSNLLRTNAGDRCNAVTAAFNKLDEMSGVGCDFGYNGYDDLSVYAGADCSAVAAAFNKYIALDGVSGVTCYYGINLEVDGDCDAVAARLTAILQGPTCKHGNPIPGPSGGGACTGECDHG